MGDQSGAVDKKRVFRRLFRCRASTSSWRLEPSSAEQRELGRGKGHWVLPLPCVSSLWEGGSRPPI